MVNTDITGLTLAARYRVHEKLGEGAMGSVYRAEDLQLQRTVALKILRKEWVERHEVKQRLEHECRLMARLGPHPNIVTLFDRMEHEGCVILIMEYVPGETLEAVIQRTVALSAPESDRKTTPFLTGVSTITLDQKGALDIACQCLGALDFAHCRGVVHRDIKPSNILVMREHNGVLRARIMDFGIGKAVKGGADQLELTTLTRMDGPGPGTPAYMAPEQIDPVHFGEIGPQTDIYSMGVTLYEMLTLRLPFEGTYTELLRAHTSVDPPDPRSFGITLPQSVTAALRRSLRKAVAERYAAASEFQTDLAAAALGGGTVVEGVPSYQPVKPAAVKAGTRTRPLAVVVAGIATLGVAGAVMIMLIPNDTTTDAPPVVQESVVAPLPPRGPSESAVTTSSAPTFEVQEAREAAAHARNSAQSAIEEGGRYAGDAPAMYEQGAASWDQAEAAYSNEDWGHAHDAFRRSEEHFIQAQAEAGDYTARAQQEVRAAARAAEQAERDAKTRYEEADSAIANSGSYQDGQRAFESARELEHEGAYSAAARRFEEARLSYQAAVPAPSRTEPRVEEESESKPATSARSAPKPAPAPDPTPGLEAQYTSARSAAEAARNATNDLGHPEAAKGSQHFARGRAAASRRDFNTAIQEMNAAREAYNKAP